MQANPQAGIIQTVPLPARQDTMFGRFLQFAAGLYGPMLANGLAFWQCDNANYWATTPSSEPGLSCITAACPRCPVGRRWEERF
jgi:hypothetical protein